MKTYHKPEKYAAIKARWLNELPKKADKMLKLIAGNDSMLDEFMTELRQDIENILEYKEAVA